MLNKKEIISKGIRFSVEDDGKEVGHAYLYVMNNDLHEMPFGFMEDVFVDESCRGRGLGKDLVNEVITAARTAGCYKLVGASRYDRPKVHELYLKLGFEDHGKEFRIDFF